MKRPCRKAWRAKVRQKITKFVSVSQWLHNAQCTMYNVLVRLLSAEGKYKYNVHCTQCKMYVYYPQKSSTSTVRELSLGDNWALLGRDP